MEFLLILVVLGAFAVAASEFGIDSRDSSDDPHRQSYPVGIC